MPIVKTKGAASSQGFGEFAQASTVANYIEDVFSTYLYTGNSATNAISNGIDLSNKGGLVWIKNRSFTTDHFLADTVRGIGGVSGSTYYLQSNTTNAQSSSTNLMSADATGFTLLPNATSTTNGSYNYASWTFRKQPKFFDVVTYTGTGSAQNIAHSLGSTPGCIFVKRTNSGTNSWVVYHTSLGNTQVLQLNTTDATVTGSIYWNNTSPTSTVFSIGTSTSVNASGGTYVAYLFAHNAGGFGLTGTDNVISCGSFTTDGSGNATVNLGYEPQWVLHKESSTTGNWKIEDTMRGMYATSDGNILFPNLSNAETTGNGGMRVNATGFNTVGGSSIGPSTTYIYIAIRRGPMKVPTSGTSVFAPVAYTGTGAAGQAITTGFVPDMVWWKKRSSVTNWRDATLLAGVNRALSQNLDAAEESNAPYYISSYQNTGFTYGDSDASYNTSGQTYIADGFGRAPSFFDVVCYTGDGTADSRTFTHNLGVTPQLVMVKRRSSTSDWVVTFNTDHAVLLNSTNADTGYSNATGNYANGILIGTNATTLTQYSGASGNSACNASGSTYVAYLFATCAGVSKVGSYTGTGTTQTISCGFTGGARFVLLKATSTTGNWMVYDTARGMTNLTDPFLSLNSTSAETATLGACTTVSTGFAVNESILAGVNTNGVSFVYLAIA